MQGFDFDKLRAHRRAEAAAHFPLLRGCPNTEAIARLTYLDGLSEADRFAFVEQLSDIYEREVVDGILVLTAQGPTPPPLVGPYLRARRSPAEGAAFMPVKTYAGVCRDASVGGFAGWAEQVAMPAAARVPAAAHAASLDDLIPVAPRRLRKLLDTAMTGEFAASAQRISSDHTRYTGAWSDGAQMIDILYAQGMGPSYQFSYHFAAKLPDGRGVSMKSYEDVWRLPARWDYVTEANAARSVAHFVRLIAMCQSLI